MATPTATSVYRVEILYQQQSQSTENVIHVHDLGVTSIARMDEVAVLVIAWLIADWFPLLPATTIFNKLIITDLTTLTSPRKEYTNAAAIAGGSGGSLPSSVTFAVHKGGPGRGRNNTGRLYVPGIPVNATSGNFLNAASAAEYRDALNSLSTDLSAINPPFEYGIISCVQQGLPIVPCDFNATPTHSWADLALDVERRRAAGRGQ